MLNCNTVFRGQENVTDFLIGDFGDKRLNAMGGLLFKKVCSQLSTSMKNLAGSRALEVGFGRFLRNEKVSIAEIESTLANKTNQNCIDKSHVLAISDTVENTFPTHKIKKNNFGASSDKNTKGFFGHPVIVMDAENKDILGISSIQAWSRDDNELTPRSQRLIENKESFKWIKAAQTTAENITNPDKITMIYDREGDIYELFDRIPNNKMNLLIRSNHDRKINNGEFLSEYMNKIIVFSEYNIELPTITGKRIARVAKMQLKFSEIIILKPRDIKNFNNEKIELTCVEAIEIGDIPTNEKPVHWRILTTHKVTTADEAQQIVSWYTWRWTIEQIFRTTKSHGLDIENSLVEDPKVLLRMFVLGIAAAVKVMCLVNARDGKTNRPASDVFNSIEIAVLTALLSTLQGTTIKQKNPFFVNSLSWAAWIIARLGGWTGYRHKTARPPGPITMYKGLSIFNNYVQGWMLSRAKDVCIR